MGEVGVGMNSVKTRARRVSRRHTTVTMRSLLAVLAVLALHLAFAVQALADGGAEAAAREVAARYDARVLDVKTSRDEYRVKLLLPSGKIKVVLVPRSIDSASEGDEQPPKGNRPESRGMPVDSMLDARFSGAH